MSNVHPDQNLAVKKSIERTDVVFYDVRKDPFRVYGLYRYRTEPDFKRLPDEVAQATSHGVSELYRHTAGGRVRFCTDSPFIAIRAEMPVIDRFPHCALTGSAGFDLYFDDPETGISRYWRTFVPPFDMTAGYESLIDLKVSEMRYVTINFPTYAHVKNLWIGVMEGAFVGEGLKYRDCPPVVYYGSSITEGGCASRPGNVYSAVLSRKFNTDYINLGFSGSGKGEDAIVDYMATLPMSAFVSDYDHNAPDAEHLAATHRKMYEKIRAAHPDIPYVMISRQDYDLSPYDDCVHRREVIEDTFRYAYANGDRNVYYVDGEGIFRTPHADMATVDGLHPNDYGFALLADHVGAALEFCAMFRYFHR